MDSSDESKQSCRRRKALCEQGLDDRDLFRAKWRRGPATMSPHEGTCEVEMRDFQNRGPQLASPSLESYGTQAPAHAGAI